MPAANSVKATMKANGYTPPFRIDPGKVCWAGDGKTWVLLFADLSAFVTGRKGETLVRIAEFAGHQHYPSELEHRAQWAAQFALGRVRSDRLGLTGITPDGGNEVRRCRCRP